MTGRAMLARTARTAGLALALAACSDRETAVTQQGDAAVHVARPADVRATPPLPSRFRTIGHDATRAEIRAWDIDVNPAGNGLPQGRGTYAAGVTLFAQKCAACHGARGEGMGPYPRLIGRDPRDGFPFGQDLKYVKTVGNYWPYATTLYDYINRAMPLTAPGSLRPDEIYSITAFLLAENDIIDRNAVMDARSLPRVKMPAHDRFVVDDRKAGAGFR
jgi:cytochrome c